MNKTERIRELVVQLNGARKAYYAENREILSNLTYDTLYDELELLEKDTGIIFTNSPTRSVGYEAVDELPKEQHESPMLSLDKTKDVEALRAFIGSQRTLLSWKLDGLTVVLTYRDGILYKAVTRGNGVIGEVVTNNAQVFDDLPLHIHYKGELLLRGEAVITYSDFDRLNEEIADVDARYKNPRNLCSGSVRQLNNQITAKRHVHFLAFALMRAKDIDFKNSRACQLHWLKEQGFETVEYQEVTRETLNEVMKYFSERVLENDFPSDGLVAIYDDIAYGKSLGSTSKFPRNACAFKWADEQRETTLREIEWSPSRTGLINPIAVFEPVELEGTTVSRASVHNVSILKQLKLGIGDAVEVYKANMIIPQIARNLTQSGTVRIPEACPACGGATRIASANDVEMLYCVNEECPAKQMKSFTLFVSRDALNIDGMSEATLKKFMAHGLIHVFGDIFELDRYAEKIKAMDGFGEKSWQKLWQGIQKARCTTLSRVIYGLGIPNIGIANAKMICQEMGQDLERIRHADREHLNEIDGIGDVIAQSFVDFFENADNNRKLNHLLKYLKLGQPEEAREQILQNLIFVITGEVKQFSNRSELKSYIESLGGKVTGSVTSKTNYLINNDAASSSSKAKKARELNIPILSEADFMELAAG